MILFKALNVESFRYPPRTCFVALPRPSPPAPLPSDADRGTQLFGWTPSPVRRDVAQASKPAVAQVSKPADCSRCTSASNPTMAGANAVWSDATNRPDLHSESLGVDRMHGEHTWVSSAAIRSKRLPESERASTKPCALMPAATLQVWKPALQQAWKPALRGQCQNAPVSPLFLQIGDVLAHRRWAYLRLHVLGRLRDATVPGHIIERFDCT